MTQEKQYSETLQRVMQHNAINDHLKLVNDAKDRLASLAKELGADSYKASWSIQDEGDGEIEYRCNVGIQMPSHWMGSYVSADHPFEEAEKTIRSVHAEWKKEYDSRKARREAEAIKQKLYDDYLAQLSKTPF